MSIGDHERARVTRFLVMLIDKWGVEEEHKARLLNMSEEEWTKVKAGALIADNSAVLGRAEKLVKIHKMILLLVGGNMQLAYDWVSRINMGLEGNSALSIILSDGDRGVEMVAAYLRRQFV